MVFRGLVLLASTCVAAAEPIVVVTGATGQTGVLLYKALQAKGVKVRAFVRSVDKARKLLACEKCDESEGIFVGDVTKKDTLVPAMQGATALAIVTSAEPVCAQPGNLSSCVYREGAYPVDIDFKGGRNQLEAFAEATKGKAGPVVLCSSAGTTDPNMFLNKLGNGNILFYKLVLEADIAAAGVPYTIVKPCGLTNGPAGQAELVASHDDSSQLRSMSRADVARVMAEALLRPQLAAGLRFDLCSRPGPATGADEVFEAARFPWQRQLQVAV